MFSPYRIPPNSHKRKQLSNRAHDLEGPQSTSNDIKRPQLASKESTPIIPNG